jgi:small subunit ribosomal protein S10e
MSDLLTLILILELEGVLVAKKDVHPTTKHSEIDVPNLYVIKLLQSLKSRNYVTETFNWQYYYWYLTNEGIEYLRDYLHLPEEIVPTTLKKPRTTAARPGARPEATGRESRGPRGPPREGEKKVGAPSADFKPDFVRSMIDIVFLLPLQRGFGRGGARREGGRGEYRREQAPGERGGLGRGAPRQQ